MIISKSNRFSDTKIERHRLYQTRSSQLTFGKVGMAKMNQILDQKRSKTAKRKKTGHKPGSKFHTTFTVDKEKGDMQARTPTETASSWTDAGSLWESVGAHRRNMLECSKSNVFHDGIKGMSGYYS